MGSNGSKCDGSIHTESGSLSTCSFQVQQGGKGICQDMFLACEGFLGEKYTTLIAVFDGHGVHGHTIARTARDKLPETLGSALVKNLHRPSRMPEPGSNGISLPPGGVSDALWEKAFRETFAAVDEDLVQKHDSKCTDSGSTSVVVLKRGMDLVVAHIGDARAVLGTMAGSKLVAHPLTVDHKAGEQEEKARIIKAGGRVLNFYNSVDRVFAPGKHEPGLAVARAFGDFDLKPHGVISVPAVTSHSIQAADKFIIIASDGLWDVVDNQEAVDFVASAGKGRAAKVLIKQAVALWNNGRGSSVRDDISVVVLFF